MVAIIEALEASYPRTDAGDQRLVAAHWVARLTDCTLHELVSAYVRITESTRRFKPTIGEFLEQISNARKAIDAKRYVITRAMEQAA